MPRVSLPLPFPLPLSPSFLAASSSSRLILTVNLLPYRFLPCFFPSRMALFLLKNHMGTRAFQLPNCPPIDYMNGGFNPRPLPLLSHYRRSSVHFYGNKPKSNQSPYKLDGLLLLSVPLSEPFLDPPPRSLTSPFRASAPHRALIDHRPSRPSRNTPLPNTKNTKLIPHHDQSF